MNIIDAVRSVNKRFTYIGDKKNYNVDEHWTVMYGDRLEGDCEDYSLTVMYLCKDSNYFKFLLNLLVGRKIRLYRCKIAEGASHVVLRVGDKFVDNAHKRLLPFSEIERLGYWNVHKYPRWLALMKLLIAAVRRKK